MTRTSGNLFVDGDAHRLPRLGGDRPRTRHPRRGVRALQLDPDRDPPRRTSGSSSSDYCALLGASRASHSTRHGLGAVPAVLRVRLGRRPRARSAWARSGSPSTSGSAARHARRSRRSISACSSCWRHGSARSRSLRAIPPKEPRMSLYDVPIATLDGKPGALEGQKGNVTLHGERRVVLRAHAAVHRPRERCSRSTRDKGFSVIGLPCNQFGAQEPGTPEEIATFCSTNYDVTFPLTEKIEVNGDGRHPLYQELTQAGRRRRPHRRHPLELREVPHRARRRGRRALLAGGRARGGRGHRGDREGAGRGVARALRLARGARAHNRRDGRRRCRTTASRRRPSSVRRSGTRAASSAFERAFDSGVDAGTSANARGARRRPLRLERPEQRGERSVLALHDARSLARWRSSPRSCRGGGRCRHPA